MSDERRVRTLFISDIHLGCRFAQTENFVTYLERVRPERLYILGDFFDGWKLGARWHWPAHYHRLMLRLLDLVRDGTELFYTPGNHDAFLRNHEVRRIVEQSGIHVQVENEFVFDAQDGRKFLVMHGDKFDIVETRWQWLSVGVTFAYEALLLANWWWSRLWRRPDRSPYSLCALFKGLVKSGVRFFSHFEQQLFEYAGECDCDGVICGHIHTPGVFGTPEMRYLNIGDWVENCTALVEHYDGTFHLESFFSAVPLRIVPPRRVLRADLDRRRREERFDDPHTVAAEGVA